MIKYTFGVDLYLNHLLLQLGLDPIGDFNGSEVAGSAGWLIIPKKFKSDSGSRSTKVGRVKIPEQIGGLMWSKLPERGENIYGQPSFRSNLGGFLFEGISDVEVEERIGSLIKNYQIWSDDEQRIF